MRRECQQRYRVRKSELLFTRWGSQLSRRAHKSEMDRGDPRAVTGKSGRRFKGGMPSETPPLAINCKTPRFFSRPTCVFCSSLLLLRIAPDPPSHKLSQDNACRFARTYSCEERQENPQALLLQVSSPPNGPRYFNQFLHRFMASHRDFELISSSPGVKRNIIEQRSS